MIERNEERNRVAAVLRGLRIDAGLSTTQLAQRLGWSQSKVSKTERARTTPSVDDVDAWALAAGASSETREKLRTLAENAAARLTEWRRELAPGRRRQQEDIQRLEAAASVIRVFSPDTIVGLAQTPAYAEAVFRIGRAVGPMENVDEVVAARIARQVVLDEESKQFHLVMGETALRRRLIAPSEMLDQITQLQRIAARPNIDVGVIPFTGPERAHQYHGFAVLGDPDVDDDALMLAETVTRGLVIRDADEIRQVIEHFNTLQGSAVRGEELGLFLQEVTAEWATR